jgi:hypothetical protein
MTSAPAAFSSSLKATNPGKCFSLPRDTGGMLRMQVRENITRTGTRAGVRRVR